MHEENLCQSNPPPPPRLRSAPLRSAPLRSAPLRSAPLRSAPLKYLRTNSAPPFKIVD